ncbi:MAG: 4-vinyl reductase, partial [Candidatus Aenigmatarchaeota archaeon]
DNEFLIEFIPSTIFSFEARKEYGNLDFSFDIYVSYIIEKGFSLIYGKEFKCEEVECYAKGDEKCLFKVRSTL